MRCKSVSGIFLSLSAVYFLLYGCGGGNPAPAPPAPVPPSALTYTVTTAVYTSGVAITANNPTNSGWMATSYGVSPALPAGLSLNTITGVITGTPTASSAANSYTVTATNTTGSTTATLNITVNSALSYSPSAEIYVVNVVIAPLSPSVAGVGMTTYGVNPALPLGLSLDPATGIISGTPLAPTATANYTVTATNAGASNTAVLNITVNDVSTSAQIVPNMDQQITPLMPTGAQFQELDTGITVNGVDWLAQDAATSVVSPDGNTLLVLTSGYNAIFGAGSTSNLDFEPKGNSPEWVFVYDISTHTPIVKQVLPINFATYHGIVFDPASTSSNGHFYVPGCSTDNVHTFTLSAATGGIWAEENPSSPALAMAHKNSLGIPMGVGLSLAPPAGTVQVNAQVFVYPCAAGAGISPDGQNLVVANYYNDSISVFTGGYGKWKLTVPNLDLRPGKSLAAAAPGTPGGEYPFWVQVAGSGAAATAYISSIRDREIDVVPLTPPNTTPATPLLVTARIPVKGQPNKMTLNKAGTLLYVAEDQSDTVDVIDTDPTHAINVACGPATYNTVLESIPVIAPPGLLPAGLEFYTGANTNSVTLSKDEKTLYVTNGNLNNVAVVPLTGNNQGDQVAGLIPTGWYPNFASISGDGTWLYVVNAKSPTGANPLWCYAYGPPFFQPDCLPHNQYNPQLTRAGLQSFPIPAAQLSALTAQVLTNNRLTPPLSTESAGDIATMATVRGAVKHVIFIIKENRTYDQVLGDLTNPITGGVAVGNGNSSLTQWGHTITPNLHQLALDFVTLDDFLTTAQVSVDGWLWTTAARSPDLIEHEYPVTYSARGLSLESEGDNRSVNVAIPTVAERVAANPLMPNDPDILAGQADVGAPDGPNNEVNTGYLWDAAMRAGLSVRSYGFFVDTTCYNEPDCQIPLAHDPAATNTVVAHSTSVSLTPFTDPYFRGFDNNFPDYYRFKEREREFDANYKNGGLPNLSLVRLMHDHTGNFGTAIDLVNTPELMQADNDYAVALLVAKIANSIYAQDTLIFIVEDDSQDGGDHVDSHRCPAFVIGPYVKRGVVVSNRYTTIDMVRTIEEVLGVGQWLNLNDAVAHPMTAVFDTTLLPGAPWPFTAATPSCFLYNTRLPLPPESASCLSAGLKPTHDSKYWARVTKGLDFRDADRVDGVLFNRIQWRGMMGNKPYPASLMRGSGREEHEDRDETRKRERRPVEKKGVKSRDMRSD